MKIYCRSDTSAATALQRFVGKDVWLLGYIPCEIPNPYDSDEMRYETLPQGPYYIQVLSIDGDTCQAHLWDKEYFDVGAEWYTSLERVLQDVYTVPINQIIYNISNPDVYTTEELAEQFNHNKHSRVQ